MGADLTMNQQKKSQESKPKSKKSADGLARNKEREIIHIKEFLPLVSLDTLKAISALINDEMGINGDDAPAEQPEPK